MAPVRNTIGMALALFGWGCVFCHCSAPPPPQVQTEVENAAAVVQYKLLLADCRKKGRAAKSYDVYETCADALDADLCRRKALRCDDAGAP